MKPSSSLEQNILTMLGWDAKHAPTLLQQISPEIFSSRSYQAIAKACITHYEQHGTVAGAHIYDAMEVQLRRGDEGTLLRQILDSMREIKDDIQPGYVLSKLHEFLASRSLAQAIEAASDALSAGNLEEARRALYEQNTPVMDSKGIWLSNGEAMLRFLDRKETDDFSIGMDVLDDRRIVPARKQMLMLIAKKKSGKSWFCTNVAKANLLRRKSVLHITLEMSEEEVAARYVQSLFSVTTHEVNAIKLTTFNRSEFGQLTGFSFDTHNPTQITLENRDVYTIKLNAYKNRPKLLIKEFPNKSLTLSKLNHFLDSVAREGFKPDILILDMPDNMAMKGSDKRLALGDLYANLKGLASERNLALIVPSQGNRGSDNAKIITSSHVAEDWSKIGTADHVLTLTRTDDEKENGLARIYVDASRHAEDGYLVLISQSYAIGQFALDSVFMTNDVKTEMERFSGDE